MKEGGLIYLHRRLHARAFPADSIYPCPTCARTGEAENSSTEAGCHRQCVTKSPPNVFVSDLPSAAKLGPTPIRYLLFERHAARSGARDTLLCRVAHVSATNKPGQAALIPFSPLKRKSRT